jgi:hypothetical protein
VKTKYKYFIENLNSRLWYVFAFNLEIIITSRNHPPTPMPEEKDFWTNDPLSAWSFDSRENAQKYIDDINILAKYRGYVDKKNSLDTPGWNLKNCIVTEHEFI